MRQIIKQVCSRIIIVLGTLLLFACQPVPESPSPIPIHTPVSTQVIAPPITSETGSAPLVTVAPLLTMNLAQLRQDLAPATAMIWLEGNEFAIAQSQTISLIPIVASDEAQHAPSEIQSAGRFQHPNFVSTSLAANSLAWISGANVVQYWDLSQSQDPKKLGSSKSPVTGLALGPEGKKVVYATSSGDVVQVVIKNPKDTQTWKAPAWLSNLSFSPDGQRIGGINLSEYRAYIFALDGQVQKTLEYASFTGLPLTGGYFCPSWLQIAWVAGSAVQIMDLETGENGPLMNHGDAVSTLAWTKDCRYLATASAVMQADQLIPMVSLWDLSLDAKLKSLPQPVAVQSLSFSPDNRQLAVMDIAGQLRVYNLP